MLPAWFIVFSIGIRLLSGGRYAWGLLNGKARPNPVTWFLWGLTAMIAFAAQMQDGVGVQALVTFVLGLSPLLIFVLAIIKNPLSTHLTPFTLSCAAIALAGIVLWQVTNNAELAIWFSIIADAVAGFPTLVKAYFDPSSEYSQPYLLSIISMGILLLTIDTWTFAVAAFPIYMLVSNIYLLAFATLPIREKVEGVKRRLGFGY